MIHPQTQVGNNCVLRENANWKPRQTNFTQKELWPVNYPYLLHLSLIHRKTMCATSTSKQTEECLNGQFKNSLQKILSVSDLKSMNDDTQIWIMATQLVVEDGPSYRPGRVTNGRAWQPPEIPVSRVTVIKLTGGASHFQSSSSLPGGRYQELGSIMYHSVMRTVCS